MKYFSELLGSELNQKKVNREEARLLARHLSVAIAGRGQFVKSAWIRTNMPSLSPARSWGSCAQAARWVFHDYGRP